MVNPAALARPSKLDLAVKAAMKEVKVNGCACTLQLGTKTLKTVGVEEMEAKVRGILQRGKVELPKPNPPAKKMVSNSTRLLMEFLGDKSEPIGEEVG